MPYTVVITADEAKLLNAAEVEGVEGTIFTFEPRESMDILSQVADATDSEDPGRDRLTDRLATLYGQHLAKARKSASEQELPLFRVLTPSDPEPQDKYVTPGAIIDPLFDGPPPADAPIYTSEGDFVEAFDDTPITETSVQVAPPKRKRGR